MKNLILTVLTFCAFTFSFAQSNTPKGDKIQLKKNSVKVSTYLSEELKLDEKQKAIVANAFAEYGNNISKLNDKLSTKSNMTDKEKNKMTFQKMSDFTKLRDSKIRKILDKTQMDKYNKLSTHFDPMSLTMKKKKKK